MMTNSDRRIQDTLSANSASESDSRTYFRLMVSLSGVTPKGSQPTDWAFLAALVTEWSWRLEIMRKNLVQDNDEVMYVFLMRKENYKILCQVGASARDMHAVAAVMDTGAGPNCILEGELPIAVRSTVRQVPSFFVFDANGNPLSLAVIDTLSIRMACTW